MDVEIIGFPGEDDGKKESVVGDVISKYGSLIGWVSLGLLTGFAISRITKLEETKNLSDNKTPDVDQHRLTE